MEDWTLRLPWAGAKAAVREPLITREWIVTNGLGGYASGTISGAVSRRFHGFLIAALPAPFGRRMMLNYLSELIRLPSGETFFLTGEERASGVLNLPGSDHLTEFRIELGLPTWRYEFGDFAIEKRIMLVHGQNTAHLTYSLVRGEGPVRLKLLPAVHFRPHEASVALDSNETYVGTAVGTRFEIATKQDLPKLRMTLKSEQPAVTIESTSREELLYRVEESRGYDSRGRLWSPGYFRANLHKDRPATLIASTETWDMIDAITPAQALEAERERHSRLVANAHQGCKDGPAREFVLAADQFVINPVGRIHDAAWAKAAGDEVRSVIAGYHWFTDWGRDTMISLEGLTLTTGRFAEAGYILRTFAHYIKDGLLPNLFPEGERLGLYHTADATLWFFHALNRYVTVTGDRTTLKLLLPAMQDILSHHIRGTRFGIGVDTKDGLLTQGQEGYQLTWMDAKVGDWVVTPRRGKAVEINALWYNALRITEGWLRDANDTAAADALARQAEQTHASFNARFWYEEGKHLYDVVDGPLGTDNACRPNQVMAISLEHPVLDRERWEPVMRVVAEKLVTPVGLRSLAPGHPDYKPRYYGDLRSRDAAYHQGTVWAWLIGPYVDAYLKLHPDDLAGGRKLLDGFVAHLSEAGVGSISEIFDAEEPFTPRGCIAQAWSVAEVLRCWARTGPVAS
ncbi:MAG TPA: amylo-alpha-1,6-glucosidase [Gemmataceae bacterium]|jgi:predicted glycogen debranching enzyme|nr:amylo-alpha-1,6-glucosidase [Gemmataceae bacterium]